MGEVHDSADGILVFTRHKEVRDVVMAVEVFALSAVFVEAMSCAELDPAHDGKAHIRFLDRGGYFGVEGCVLGIIRHWKAWGLICVDPRRDGFSFPGFSK